MVTFIFPRVFGGSLVHNLHPVLDGDFGGRSGAFTLKIGYSLLGTQYLSSVFHLSNAESLQLHFRGELQYFVQLLCIVACNFSSLSFLDVAFEDLFLVGKLILLYFEFP